MNLQKVPALALAAILQIVPLARVASVNQAVAPTGFAVVMRWLAGAVALLGSYHAVSGASAAVAGVIPINPTTQAQTGPVTTHATGTNGQTFAYRIYVTNPGINPQQAYYRATGLPPGLTVNTNLGANGDILGSPTTPGVYSSVTLIAGNANYVGTVSTNITITIVAAGGTSPPTVTTPPKSQTVTAGTNVTLTVGATGTAPLHYLWSFNGTDIATATTSALQLTNVQVSQSGTYAVSITNSAGKTAASATLSVLLPPAITTPPQAVTTNAGATVSFSVVASGSPNLSYLWQLNGSPLNGATSSTLTLTNVQTANQGDYSVAVTNLVGSATSASAHLTVQTQTSGPLQLANWQVVNGQVSFDVSGPSQTNVVLWSSADLAHWTALGTNSSSSGTVHFNESTGPGPVEFYRATLSP